MDLHLKDKVIIVTGGSSGIGKGIAISLANEGAIPFIVGRKEQRVIETVEAIKANGGKADYGIADLVYPEQCKQVIKKLLGTYNRIEGLVNNAGVNDGVGLENGNYDKFMESIAKNVTHYYTMAHLSLPYLKKSKGAIVNIGSKTSLTGQGGTSGYAAANGGRNALTREWAVELLPYSIRVNAVIVAECYTPMYERWIETFSNSEAKLKSITDQIPLENRMTTAKEIADTVAFLISDRSSHTTGQLLFVDGGYSHLDRALAGKKEEGTDGA
jgi:L-fucose dehydrogenase